MQMYFPENLFMSRVTCMILIMFLRFLACIRETFWTLLEHSDQLTEQHSELTFWT